MKFISLLEIVPCKFRWKIETPGHLEQKKGDIVKVLKKAFDIVKISTSHEIEDVYEGSITIDTLLPMSKLQYTEAFHHSIRNFLTTIVNICGIDTTIPLKVKVQITLCDLDQGRLTNVSYNYRKEKLYILNNCLKITTLKLILCQNRVVIMLLDSYS